MYEKEKLKGVPAARGLWYLIAGMVIGGVAVLAVIFMLTLQACACEPQQPPTTLPLIPTPIPGVTGTAAAQAVLPVKRLITFRVDETMGLIALSYEGKGAGVYFVETRPWSQMSVGESRQLIQSGAYLYDELSFNAALSSLSMSSTTRKAMQSFNLKTDQFEGILPDTQQALYSPDGRWLAFLNTDGFISMSDLPSHSARSLILQGKGHLMTFSPDSTLLAVGVTNDLDPQYEAIEIFSLPDLTPIGTYELSGLISSPMVFSPNNDQLAFGVDQSLNVMLKNGSRRYFDVYAPIHALAFDPTGQWLAINEDTSAKITLYPLEQTVKLPPEPLMPQALVSQTPIAAFQFVKDGLLIGDVSSTLTLYRWTGDTWGDAKIVMTEADL